MTIQQKEISQKIASQGEIIIDGFVYRFNTLTLQSGQIVKIVECCQIRQIADRQVYVTIKFWGV